MTQQKNIFKIILLTLFVIISFNSKSQYTFKLEINDNKDSSILLGYYYLDKTYAIDTAFNNGKGKFIFKNKNRTLDDGIYFFSNQKGKYCEFLISGNTNITFSTNDSNWSLCMTVKNDKNEKIYFDYIRQSNIYSNEFYDLRSQKNSISKEDYDKKVNLLRIKADSLKEDFIKQNPNHLLTKILQASKPIDVPKSEIIYKDDKTIDSLQMRINEFNYYKRHYFDNVDFSCGGLIRTPKGVFYTMYRNYWDNIMKYEKADSLIFYSILYIEKAKKNPLMFKYILNDLTSHYLQDGIMGHDKVYVALIDKYFKSGEASWMSPSDLEMNVNRADKWRHLLIGQTIPDLACPETDTSSTWHHLNEITNKYKILIFWSVECGHCTVEIPKIAEFYNNNKDIYDIGIMSVHTEGNINNMIEFEKKNNIHWISTNGSFANYDWRTYFDIEKTPIIYILDKNNKILAKNLSSENLQSVLDAIINKKLTF
jgi:thiol-disulfide isomerase/thioredoxin